MAEINDFWSQYSKLCLRNKICPSKGIMKYLKGTDLSIIVEAIRSEHWKFLLLALCKDNSLTRVHFASCESPHEDEDELIATENAGLKLIPVPTSQIDCKTERCIGCCSPAVYRRFIPLVDIDEKMKKQCQYFPTPYGRTPKNINNIALAVGGLLQISQNLSILKLENLPLKVADAEKLASGLSKSSSLKYLSLSGCNFEDKAVSIICKSLNASLVAWLDLSFCAVNLPDIEAVANVIKAHSLRRCNDMFQETLRNQVPCLQEMPGLTRISLNCNFLEDKAFNCLIESLADDLWIKVLDLQNCDIDNAGAIALLKLARTNKSLVIIDLRMNQIDESLLSHIAEQLEQNKAGKDIKFSEVPLWRPSQLVRKYNSIGKVKPLKKPAAHKLKTARRVTKSYLDRKKIPHPEAFCSRHEHFEKKIKYTYVKSLQSAKEIRCAVIDGLKEVSSQTPPDPHDVMVKNLRHRLQNEMKIKKFLLSKCRQVNIENVQLRQLLKSQNDDIFIDQETFFDVKHTFEKLKVFFDVMKKYGLWEYISMLGFDESTDVILEENNSQKCMKVTRDESYAAVESPPEFDRDVCCNCRKLDYKHRKMEPPDDVHNCVVGTSTKALHSKVPMNQKIAYKILQEAVIDYTSSSPHHILNSKPAAGRMSENVSSPQDAMKPSGSKPSGSASQNTTTGAQMLIKKFSYSNMPKQLKELVSPTDFYNIVKKELERCENEAKKPYNPIPTESYESSSSAQVNSTQSKQNSYKMAKCINDINVTASAALRRGSSTKLHSKISDDDDDDNLPISELIAREKAARNLAKKDAKSPVSSMSNSNVQKNISRAKIKETKSLSKSEEVLSQSKLKFSSSQTNSKKVQSKYNASSDEINSSDSIVTASDKVSPHSSVSSSSSNKSHSKLSDVTDASTFGEIESITDAEVVSETFLPRGSLNEHFKSSADTVSSGLASSHSSTLKDTSESKSNKSNKPAISESASTKDPSKKSDKSAKSNTQSQGKTKNANKQNKNRPKSNSSKSSSIPSLGDITTVSSKSLNTDSVMNQISGSEENKSKEKK